MNEYVAHIVDQTTRNVEFLVGRGHISRQDGDAILSRLPDNVTGQIGRNDQSSNAIGQRNVVPPPTLAHSNVVQARALWAYNEHGSEPDDLSFNVGDIIEIVAETNSDWWTGKSKGKQGLFPSNHVEKLSSTNNNTSPAPQLLSEKRSLPPVAPAQKAVYKPFMAVHHGVDTPPQGTTSQVNSVGLQEVSGQEQKKNKFGALGNTMARSAASGAGFGAGAAIGGGLVRAIF